MAEYGEKISFDQPGIVRFITADSVDDGKSTLIGRLLHDSKSIFEGQLTSISNTTRKRAAEGVCIVIDRRIAGRT